MRFRLTSTLRYVVNSQSTILCSLRCVETGGQKVLDESLTTSREAQLADLSMGMEQNRFSKIDITHPADFDVHYQATVSTTAERMPMDGIETEGVHALTADVLPYLFPSRYAPADRMRAVALDLFGEIDGHLQQSLAIEDWLYRRIAYRAGFSNEQSWALETYETRSGVCRDFAHLGIAFCRALSIPARYVTVYAYALQPKDFHAVFEVFVDGIWYLMDGTRLAPLNGMVRIAIGRDAADAAVATLFGGIEGAGIEVDAQIDATESDSFMPVTRDQLRSEGTALFLG